MWRGVQIVKRLPASRIARRHFRFTSHQKACLLKRLTDCRQAEGTRLAAALDAQEAFLMRFELAPRHGLAILRVHATTWKDVFVRHEGMASGALAHEDSRLLGVSAHENQRCGVLGAGAALSRFDDIAIIFLVER